MKTTERATLYIAKLERERFTESPPEHEFKWGVPLENDDRLQTITTLLFLLSVVVGLTILYVGRSLFLPIFAGILLSFLLEPVVAGLEKLKIPRILASGIVIVTFLASVLFGAYSLAGPATNWLESAPERIVEVEEKLRSFRSSIEKMEEATNQIEDIARNEGEQDADEQVQAQETSLAKGIVNQTGSVVLGFGVAIGLVFFLLASGRTFLRKLVTALPNLDQKRRAVTIAHRIRDDISHYIFSITLINIGLGATVGTVFWLFGINNPLLWGTMVAVLNFLPYVGALVGTSIIMMVSILTFDSIGYALWPPLLYLAINITEGTFITPAILGRRLRLHPVVVFVSLLFWSWLWGIVGAVLAVPLVSSFKIVCDNIYSLNRVGAFLGRADE